MTYDEVAQIAYTALRALSATRGHDVPEWSKLPADQQRTCIIRVRLRVDRLRINVELAILDPTDEEYAGSHLWAAVIRSLYNTNPITETQVIENADIQPEPLGLREEPDGKAADASKASTEAAPEPQQSSGQEGQA